MKRNFLVFILIITFLSVLSINNYSLANNLPTVLEQNIITNNISDSNINFNHQFISTIDDEENYTKAYKEYLKLTDEEKAKVSVVPRKYNIPLDTIYEDETDANKSNNLFNLFSLFSTKNAESELPSSYNLQDHIHISVKNQEQFRYMLGICKFKSFRNKFSYTYRI